MRSNNNTCEADHTLVCLQLKKSFRDKQSVKCSTLHFGNLINTIKERRENLKINQENLAKTSGVGSRTLKQFECGKGNPTSQTIQKIADVLGLEVCLKVKRR